MQNQSLKFFPIYSLIDDYNNFKQTVIQKLIMRTTCSKNFIKKCNAHTRYISRTACAFHSLSYQLQLLYFLQESIIKTIFEELFEKIRTVGKHDVSLIAALNNPV